MKADLVTVVRIECSPSEAVDLMDLLLYASPSNEHQEVQLNRWTAMLAALNIPEQKLTTHPDNVIQETP